MVPNVLLDTWTAIMWQACWQGGLVVLAVWSICRVIPSMPVRFQCWLWRLAILKFMLVIVCPTLLNLPLLPARSASAAAAVPKVALPASMETPVSTDLPATLLVDQAEPSPSEAIEIPSLGTILCFAWCIGLGACLVLLLAAWYKSIRLRKQSRTIDCASLIDELTMQGKLFGLRRLPKLVSAPGGGSPMLIGVLRPTIVLPTETLGRLTISEQAMVLGHELAHVCRDDLLWALIASIARAVFFFHPLVWWSVRQLNLAQEVAADELVITRQHHEPVHYASLLVSVVSKLGSRPLVSTISVETTGTMRSLTRRLAAMTHIGQTSRRVVVSSSILLGAVVLLGVVPWRLVAAEPKADETISPSAAEKTVVKNVEPLVKARPDAAPKDGVEQARAIAEIEKLDGKVTIDENRPGKPAIRVDLQRSEVTDAELKHLKGLTELQTLNLWRTKITGTGLVHLKGLTKLQGLYMSETPMTDVGLEHLKGLTRLKSLGLGGTEVTDAGLEHLKRLTNLQWLDLCYTQVTDAGLEHLKGLTQLQSLQLMNLQVTDTGLEHLKGLTKLQSLTISSTQVTDKGLEHLKGLTQLKSLSLGHTEVTDAGLEHLKGLTKLQTLYLGDTQVTDAGLEHLKGLTKLETLGLDDTRVSDAGLEHLRRLTNLQFLNLSGTGVTDDGLIHLKKLTRLQLLYLGRTQVTGAGLEHLKGLTQLRELGLSSANVTDESVRKLQQALPNCQNRWDDL